MPAAQSRCVIAGLRFPKAPDRRATHQTVVRHGCVKCGATLVMPPGAVGFDRPQIVGTGLALLFFLRAVVHSRELRRVRDVSAHWWEHVRRPSVIFDSTRWAQVLPCRDLFDGDDLVTPRHREPPAN